MYICDRGNNMIRAMALDSNTVTTFAGSTTAGFADGTGAAPRTNPDRIPTASRPNPDGIVTESPKIVTN